METSTEVKKSGNSNNNSSNGSSGECYREEFVRRGSWLGGVRKY
jgi:hypothetical protein